MTRTTGHSSFLSFPMYSAFLSLFSMTSVTYNIMSASPMAVSTKSIMFLWSR